MNGTSRNLKRRGDDDSDSDGDDKDKDNSNENGKNESGDNGDNGGGFEPVTALSPDSTAGTAQELVTRALQFLSTASPETIGGIAVGLAACTYLILGRLGLLLIGTLGGIVLHATCEAQGIGGHSVEDARREKGLDVVKRILDLRDRQRSVEEEFEKDDFGDSFDGFQPETATALNDLVEAAVRDYVKWWYHPILPKDTSFPAAARLTLTNFILSLSHHLSRKRPADSFLDFLTNSSSIVIVFLTELSTALSPSISTSVPAAEAVYTYLSANPESNLSNILNEKQQLKKFNMIAEDILENFLEKATYRCGPARAFLREILGGVVLEMTLKSCSKPEWINGWIVHLLEDGEPDLNQAIDAGMGAGTDLSSPFSDLDGNVGNVGLTKPPKSLKEKQQRQEVQRHRKRLSKAEEAMEEAMEEAKRLSQLIAEDDAKKAQGQQVPAVDKPQGHSSLPSNGTEGLNSGSSLPVQSKSTTEIRQGSSASMSENSKPEYLVSPVKRNPVESSTPKPLDLKASPNVHIRESVESPVSPHSMKPISIASGPTFTNFDQIIPQSTPRALQEGSPLPRRQTLSLTLHNASITIYDDSTTTDKGKLRNKPTGDYLVQIEPASSQHPGWMIVRRYADLETLHEVLRRIAQISGVTAFVEQHQTLPNWKEHTKASLRGELERYLRDACWYQPLAESEGMKRFLEKDQGQSPGPKNGFPGIGWPNPSAFETMGKGMLDVLASAPKGVAEGGKVIGGGITGVFSNISNLGQKKPAATPTNVGMHTAGRASTSTLPRIDSISSITGSRKGRVSEDSLRAAPIVTQPAMIPPMERRPSHNSIVEDEHERESRVSTSARSSMSGRRSATHSRDPSRAPSRKGTPLASPTHGIIEEFRLPPPPSDIPDDYRSQDSAGYSRTESSSATTRTPTSTAPSQQSPGRLSFSASRNLPSQLSQTPNHKPRKEPTPLTEQETRVAVELLFAVINELYTLSSAWNIRRTLLTAAKSFLLRPGNPSLSAIQSLIQDSVIASSTSDSGIASHLRKLRENTLPTEDELKTWPSEMSPEEKERLRIKARKLLVERGVPAALTGVMGQAATGEAMGRVFDCVQVEEVARGLIFGLLLQGVRAVAH